MGVDVITLALAKSYTDNSIKGTTGPIAGKNCTIASIQKTLHSNIVTFKWTADDGTTQTRTMEVKDGNNVVDVQFVEETEDTETYEFVMENGDTHEFTIPRGYSPKIEEHTKTENVYTLDIYQRVEASVEKTTTPNLKGASTKAEINSETENLYNLKITTYDGNETSVIITPNMLGKKWWVGELVTRHTDPETGEYLPISTDTVPDSTVGDLYLNSKNDFVFQRIDDVIVQEQVVQQWKFLGCIAGEDNYTLWKKIPGNEGKTIVEYFEFLSGEGIPCHIVVSKPDSKEPTTLEKHWYYYQNDVESNRIPGYIDNTAWWYDIQPLEHLTEIKIGKYACYTGQMYINGEVTHEYAHVEGYQAKLYWHDLRENGGKCRVIVFNVSTGAVVMAGDEVDVFYSTEPVEGYEIHPVNIIPLGSWYQTMYIKDTTGGVVNHEITIAPQ